jgi:hypothetical protein
MTMKQLGHRLGMSPQRIDVRARYIAALRDADAGAFVDLTRFARDQGSYAIER